MFCFVVASPTPHPDIHSGSYIRVLVFSTLLGLSKFPRDISIPRPPDQTSPRASATFFLLLLLLLLFFSRPVTSPLFVPRFGDVPDEVLHNRLSDVFSCHWMLSRKIRMRRRCGGGLDRVDCVFQKRVRFLILFNTIYLKIFLERCLSADIFICSRNLSIK